MNNESEYPPIPMSPDYLAAEFAKSIAGNWCYVHDYNKWYHSDGEKWQLGKVEEIKDMVRDFCRKAVNREIAQSLSDSIKRSFSNSSYLSSLLDLTKSDRLIATTSEKIGLPPKKKNYRGRYPCP
jgi:hypothetical protein